MTSSHARAILPAPSFETLLETLDAAQSYACAGEEGAGGAVLSYRTSPDGSVTMGTDPLSGQVVLIVQSTDQIWEIALPPKIARFAPSQSECSLAAAQHLAQQAFHAYWASRAKYHPHNITAT